MLCMVRYGTNRIPVWYLFKVLSIEAQCIMSDMLHLNNKKYGMVCPPRTVVDKNEID